jgi:hypothetical protein
MSVQSQIDRLNAIKQRIRTNLVAQGITVPEDTKLEAMAEQILSVAGVPGQDGYTPVRGTDYWTESDKAEIVAELKNVSDIPEYWQEHLTGKIFDIKALQDAGGRDCFSFALITDIHYDSNLGKLSPTLAKRIMDECGIKFCLCMGDTQTRHGARYGVDYIESEWKDIEAMLSPIRDNLLITQGNHDGSYGMIDVNGDGTAEDGNGDGVVNEDDRTIFNLSPQKLYERIFRKVSTIDNVHFSEDGRGYYVDDTGSRVRYIILNTHVNKYELLDNGAAKYGNMRNFRFGQAQYDMVIEALKTVPSDGWSVIIGSHVPLDRSAEYVYWGGSVDGNGAQTGSPADCVIMQRMLNAYYNKTAYNGFFAGTQGMGAAYKNLADPDSSDWADGAYINSSGNVATATATDVTNYIKAKPGDTIRLKDVTITGSNRMAFYDADKKYLGIMATNTFENGGTLSVDDATGIRTLVNLGATTVSGTVPATIAGAEYVRFTCTPGESPIITVNEEIAENTGDNFDAVSVDVDFSGAKGRLIAYFGGHIHEDKAYPSTYAWNGAEHSDFYIITSRCDGRTENTEELLNQRIAGTVTEQSFDVFTVNKAERKIYATKIGAGSDRVISY